MWLLIFHSIVLCSVTGNITIFPSFKSASLLVYNLTWQVLEVKYIKYHVINLEWRVLLCTFSADMANIVLLLVIIMLVFSVIAVTLFRDIVPMYFGNLSSCILSISVASDYKSSILTTRPLQLQLNKIRRLNVHRCCADYKMSPFFFSSTFY